MYSMKGKTKIWLISIFLVVVALRLFLAFQTKGLDYEAYTVIRQVESIHDTGLPLFTDNLSYSGRIHSFSPVYHYFLASFTFIIPVELVAKIIPNILAALTVIVVFFFAFYFTKDDKLSLVIAGLSGIIPVFFDNSINNASVYTAVIPVFFLTAYFFILTHKDSKNMWKLIPSMILLTMLHPSSLILMFCFLIYILLISIENFRKSYRETELVLFFLFFVFWVNMTLYKRALLAHGDLIIFQNIPAEIVSNSFRNITFLNSIYSVGFIPLIFGLIAIYAALFVSNSKSLMLVTSISLGVFCLLWFKLISIDTGLIFLSISLIILSSYSIGKAYENLQMTKLKYAHKYFLSLLILVSIILIIPVVLSSNHDVPSNNDIAALKWMNNNTEENAVIIALPEEGSALSYFSNRKNVMDDDYLMIKKINTRYNDVESLYDDMFLTTALERLSYYSVDYIFLSEYNQRKYNRTDLLFYDESCIELVYPQDLTSDAIKKNKKSNKLNEDSKNSVSNLTINNVSKNKIYVPKIYKVNCQLLSKSESEN